MFTTQGAAAGAGAELCAVERGRAGCKRDDPVFPKNILEIIFEVL